MNVEKPIRVLVGKAGLDGHDTGAKIVSMALRDAGMEVIYSGLHRSVDEISEMALQEDVDVVGLSILSGAHAPIAQKLIRQLKEKGIPHIPVVIGGVIPKKDISVLKSLGVAEVLPFGTPLIKIIETVSELGKRAKAS